jgi:Protein of unknown function (DUF3017)
MPEHATEPIPVSGSLRPATDAVTEPMGPIDVPKRGGRWRALGSQWAFLLVLLVAAVGLVRILQYHWREGAVLVGGALVVAGLLRAVLPSARVGLIAVRGRLVDVLSYAALAGMILFVALTLTGGPFG